MKSESKEIQKKTLDWLWKAISVNVKQIIHISDNAAFAADGFRLHAVNAENLPDIVDSNEVRAIIDAIKNSTKLLEFHINPKYLIDALSGFVLPEIGTVTITVNNENLMIMSDNSDKMAIVMCIKKAENNEQSN